MVESKESPRFSKREILEHQISEVSDRIEKATDQGYSASQEEYDTRKQLQDQLFSLINPTQPEVKRRTPGPMITGYGSMDKLGKFGQAINRRANTKR